MLSYNDRCVITRPTTEKDEWDNEITEEIYKGECDYQPGGQTALSTITKNAVVYIPGVPGVESNDIIEVTSQSGRKLNGVVKLANDLYMELDGSWVTEIEIKQGTEE